MKYNISMLSIDRKHGHARIVEELSLLKPEWAHLERDGTIYNWSIPATQPIDMDGDLAKRILEILNKHGLHRSVAGGEHDPRITYWFRQQRVYSKKDLEETEYFWIDSKHLIGARSVPAHVKDCATTGTYIFLISQEAHDKMLESDLSGYDFGNVFSASKGTGELLPGMWLLESKYFLPPRQPNPTPDIAPEEYHYLRSQMKELEGIDVIYIDRELDDKGKVHSDLVVSQRFYKLWNINNFKKMIFIPCRIIEDVPQA